MKYIHLIAILVLSSLITGCATLLTGTTQRVTIDSHPQGAEIIVDGRIVGTTPARVRVDRDINDFIEDGKHIQLLMNGYYSDGYYLGTEIEPMCILNVFCPVGFIFDAATGAMVRYSSDYYNFRMVPAEEVAIPYAPVERYNDTSPVSEQQPVKEVEEVDDYEKLMKLVELYEEGLISEEEFEQEKAKIFEKKRN